MKLDLRKFYQRCNPSKTLVVENAEDRKLYIDFSSVRGSDVIRGLGRTITRLSPDEPTCQLFTGHIGCGKSTELLRLKDELEEQGFHVAYFESSEELDMADVDIADILLAIARQVSASLEKIGIKLKPGYFTNLFNEIVDFLQTPIEIEAQAELSVGLGKITAKAKESPKLRHQLRTYLEPRTSNILEAINKEILGRAKDILKQRDKEGLVVIVDNLDRVHESLKPTERTQPEYLFVDRAEQLKKLNCHIIYTIPLSLIFSNDLGRLTSRFGIDPIVLPMVPVRLRDGRDCEEGMALLRQMVLARAFPNESPEQRLCLITAVFEQPETLDRLCRVSGGHVRNLLMLLYRCLQQEDPPLSQAYLESVIRQRGHELVRAITDDESDLLRQVGQQKTVRGEAGYQTLLRSMFVFEYRYCEENWFDINPILAEAKELQP